MTVQCPQDPAPAFASSWHSSSESLGDGLPPMPIPMSTSSSESIQRATFSLPDPGEDHLILLGLHVGGTHLLAPRMFFSRKGD